jgi:23S rRNA A1618 N6-methylase RlmF
MCNPPFYGSNLEAWGWLTTRGMGPDGQGNRTRPEPSSVSTASPMESIAPGGEVQFVQQRIIESSLELQSQIRSAVFL